MEWRSEKYSKIRSRPTQEFAYSPSGTKGGVLARTCTADGAGYGPCAGEILPTQEVCGSGRDDDCNGAPLPCAHIPAWGKDYGQAGMPTNPLGLVIDTAGCLFVLAFLALTSSDDDGPNPPRIEDHHHEHHDHREREPEPTPLQRAAVTPG